MGTRIYLSDTGTTGSWNLMDTTARCRPNDLRVWLVHHFDLCMLGPLPPGDVPQHLRPANCGWNAMSGRTTAQGYVLVISDEKLAEVSVTTRSLPAMEQDIPAITSQPR